MSEEVEDDPRYVDGRKLPAAGRRLGRSRKPGVDGAWRDTADSDVVVTHLLQQYFAQRIEARF